MSAAREFILAARKLREEIKWKPVDGSSTTNNLIRALETLADEADADRDQLQTMSERLARIEAQLGITP